MGFLNLGGLGRDLLSAWWLKSIELLSPIMPSKGAPFLYQGQVRQLKGSQHKGTIVSFSLLFSGLSHIYPSIYFFCKLRILFYIFKWLEKKKKSCYVKTIWNFNFCVHKQCFIWTQPCSFVYLYATTTHIVWHIQQLYGPQSVWHTVTVWATGLKYLLSHPLKKNFADPRSSGMVEGKGINAVAFCKISLYIWVLSLTSL